MTDEVVPYRKRIGMICPDDAVNDDEYWQYLPKGVSLLWTRYSTNTRFDPISVEMVGAYGDMQVIEDSARTLQITRPQVVVFGCNSCGFVHGEDGDRKICQRITAASGSPAISVTGSQLRALKTLGAKRVAVGAPYPHEVTEKLVGLLEEAGYTVTNSRSLGLTSEWQIGNSDPSVWADLAREVAGRGADCVLLACSGIRTAPIMDPLEKELGIPVISAPAVTVWNALRTIGITDAVPARGILFKHH
jgi:maleate isomerase